MNNVSDLNLSQSSCLIEERTIRLKGTVNDHACVLPSNTFSVAEWPCGSLLLLEWPCGTFTTPLFHHKSGLMAPALATSATVCGVARVALFYSWSGSMALCYSCVFTRVRPVAHSCYYCGWNGVAQWHFATPLFFSQESTKWLTLVTF